MSLVGVQALTSFPAQLAKPRAEPFSSLGVGALGFLIGVLVFCIGA